MNHFTRPDRPRGWESRVRTARSNLKKEVHKSKLQPLPEDAVPALWRDPNVTFLHNGKQLTAKDIFSHTQHGICGYCAERVVGNETGDLDHFLPTRAITRTIENHGTELAENVSRIEDRLLRPLPPHRPGWWDKAYTWTNYVFSCNLCNRTWKQTLCLATLAGQPYDGPRHAQEATLLLNPFDDDAITDFKFDEFGVIHGHTPRGKATIETCGLDRPSLVPNRLDVVRHIEDLCDTLLQPRDPADQKARYRRLVERGGFSQPHARVVRQTAERKLNMSWSGVEAAAT